jgi:hypothetical protein
VEGYTHKEIGDLLNISEGTSKSQLSRAKVILQGMGEKNILMSVTGNVMSEELKRKLYNYEESPSGRIWGQDRCIP